MGGRRVLGALAAAFALAAVLPAPAGARGLPARCDPLDPAACLLPWPNDYFTVRDPATPTGRRLHLQLGEMPRNRFGVPINPADYNRSDGFSPGQEIITKVPGLTSNRALQASGAPTVGDIGRYADPGSPIVVIDADTLERQPIFGEVDANPPDPADRVLTIRPAVDFKDGGHYIVALRNLVRADGTPIKAQLPFRIYRDDLPSSDPAVEARRPHMEHLFDLLGRAGIDRHSLYLAWDFTVASRQSLTGRLLSMRNRAFAELGDRTMGDLTVQGRAPRFAVTGVRKLAPEQNAHVARIVKGYFTVPCFLFPSCAPGGRFVLDGSGRPVENPVPWAANFECIVPRSAIRSGRPARPSLYGHGLFGDAGEVEAGNVETMADAYDMLFCATDWTGMSTSDIPNTLVTLQDLSNFPSLADRLQQAMVDFMFLGRLMIHKDGFASDPAFRAGGRSLIDRARLFYDGNSQGGIAGGALTAVEPDLTHAVLGVPGMNYSLLLQRSSDFPVFAYGTFCQELGLDCGPANDSPLGLYDSYPKQIQRQLIISLIQILWDRGEPNGYAQFMTDHPLPDTPRHTVLLHEAFGDHQVANVATEVEARTIGAAIYQPALDSGRSNEDEPFWGIPAIPSFPYGGSALVVWDSGPPRPGDEGVYPPPLTNTPPTRGRDPHGDPRSTPAAQLQKSEFLKAGGAIVDVCAGHPCYSHGWTGP